MKGAGEMERVALVLGIGVSCSSELPAERMETGKVTRELHNARDVLLRNESSGDRSCTQPTGEDTSTTVQ